MNFLADRSPDFVKAIKEVENNYSLAKKSGEYKQVSKGGNSEGTNDEWRWFPGKSPEGGLPTLAWGHKITPKEWETKRVEFVDPKLNQMVSKDFRYGITDEEANALLLRDLCVRELLCEKDWNTYHGKAANRPYSELPDKYKGVLLNLCFNAGLVKKGVWIWKTVAKGILANNDKTVTLGMVTSYKTPRGKWVKLTSRAEKMADALGLPSKVLFED